MPRDKDRDRQFYVEGPYTCQMCGRKNLTENEIGWKEDEDGEMDESTIMCHKCFALSVWPMFKKMIKPGSEKEAERIFKDMIIKEFEKHYNRRLLRRALGKKEQDIG